MKSSKTFVAFLLALLLASTGTAAFTADRARAEISPLQCQKLEQSIASEKEVVDGLLQIQSEQVGKIQAFSRAVEASQERRAALSALISDTRAGIREISKKNPSNPDLQKLRKLLRTLEGEMKVTRRAITEFRQRVARESANLRKINAKLAARTRILEQMQARYQSQCN